MKHSRKKSRQSLFRQKQGRAKKSFSTSVREGYVEGLSAAEPAPVDYLQASEYLNTDLIEVVELSENGGKAAD